MLDDDVAYFLALAGTGSMARAAGNLGLTQPALSKALQRLEKQTGAKLVVRTSQGSSLTPAGEAFATRMRQLTRAADEAVREVRDLSGGQIGQLRIGASPAASIFTLNALLPQLQKERPAATIAFVNAFNDSLLDALVQRDLELVLCPLPPALQDGLRAELLFQDDYSLILNDAHPLSRQARISLEDLAQCDWASSPRSEFARQQTEAAFAGRGLPWPRVLVEVNSLPALLVAIANSPLVSMVNSRALLAGHLPRNVVMRPLTGVGIHCPVGMVWRRGFVSSIAQRAMELLREASAGL